jgi:tetratricopeptide (TPR) repeat protein
MNIFFYLPKPITSLFLVSLIFLIPKAAISDTFPIKPSLSPIGNYLVGRHAENERNLSLAADFLKAVLDKSPEIPNLLRRTFVLLVMEGRIKEAIPLAKLLQKKFPQDPITNLFLTTDDFKHKSFRAVTKRLKTMSTNGFTALSAPILLGWALAAQQKIDEGLAIIKPLKKEKGTLALYYLHKGLILEFANRTTEAQETYEELTKTQAVLSFRQTQIMGNFYERLGKINVATKLYDQYQEQSPGTNFLFVARQRLRLKIIPQPVIASAIDGAAEVLFWVANSLRQQRAQETTLLLAQLALHLKSNYPIMRILTGKILEMDQRLADANLQFKSVPKSSAFKQAAQMRIATNYHDMGRTNEAITIARGVSKARPHDPEPHHAVGDYLRSTEHYKEAITEYDAAIRLAEPLKSIHWRLFYKRGIVLERVKAFKKSEEDFLKALELKPNQPFVLNYLGYSWIEQGRNLEKAQDMIHKAVKLRPNDGYIIDSLGWAYFQIGNYDDAVVELERAVQYRPEDPVINDHLGDAFWQVGRKNEARFQWLHSLSLEPDTEVEKRVREKLKNGLKPITNSVIKDKSFIPKSKE